MKFRRRSSQRVGPPVQARQDSIKNALAADEVLNNVSSSSADIAAVISAESRRRSTTTRQSLTDTELQQVLDHVDSRPSKGFVKRRISASTAGATVLGTSKELGKNSENHEEMKKFMEDLKKQAKATYVPIGCAEKILEQATATAEETKKRHHDVIADLEATHREIDERTRRHYSNLILRLQIEMRTELRRMGDEKKTQEDLVENLRDTIASQTAAAVAREVTINSQLEQEKQARAKDTVDFSAFKQNMIEESRRALNNAVGDAKQAAAEASRVRIEESRRRSMERISLEDRALHTTVALVLENIISSVEEREHNQGRENLHRGLTSAMGEANVLRTELADALSKTHALLAENDQLVIEGESLRQAAHQLRAELEDERSTSEMKSAEIRQGKSNDDLLRCRLENKEAVEMMNAEDRFAVVMELVRCRREVRESSAEVAAMSRRLEGEHAMFGQQKKENEKETVNGETEKSTGDAEVDRQPSEEDTRMLDLSKRRVAELEEEALALKQELTTAKQDALDALAAAQKAEEQFLLASSQEAATLAAAQTALKTTSDTAASVGAVAAAPTAVGVVTAGAVAGAETASTGEPVGVHAGVTSAIATTATAAPAADTAASTVIATDKESSQATGVEADPNLTDGVIGLQIEKGPASDALRLEELKAELAERKAELVERKVELQTATGARRKVKSEIKEWLKDFEEKEGRPPTNDDKGTIRSQYVEHKRLEKVSAKLSDDVKSLEAEIEKKEGLVLAAGTAPEIADGRVAPTVPNTPSTPAATGNGFTDTSSAALLEQLRQENASLIKKLEESEEKKTRLKTALGELNNTTTKMLADVRPIVETTAPSDTPPPSSSHDQAAADQPDGSGGNGTVTAQQVLENRPAILHDEYDALVEESRVREAELEEGLQNAQKEAREAILAAKKAEHLREEASVALEDARKELNACQLVVDESSEAARLRQQVEVLKVDLHAKSRAATAGWDAAANAESEAEAAEARGVQAGIKRGRADAERKVRALKEELAKVRSAAAPGAGAATAACAATAAGGGTSGSDAAARADGADTAAAKSVPSSPSSTPGTLDMEATTTILGAVDDTTTADPPTAAAAAPAAAAAASDAAPFTTAGEKQVMRSASVEAWVEDDGDGSGGGSDGLSPAQRKAKEIENTERELKNLREREKDARGEADRMAAELQRASDKQAQQRERETNLVRAVATLEKEKETLSRETEMAQERLALAMELVAAHKEAAAKARQESALNAAKFRRASRNIAGQQASAAVTASAASSAAASRASSFGRGRPLTSSANRRSAEQLRLAAATLVHAIKEGTDLWRRERREECHALYVKAGGRAAAQMPPGQVLDDLRVALAAAKGLPSAKAAVTLRKAFDTVIEAAMAAKENLAAQRNAARNSGISSSVGRTGRAHTGGGGSNGGSGRSSAANSAPASTSHSRNASTDVAAKDAEAIRAALAGAAAESSTPNLTAENDASLGGGLEQQLEDPETSKVASLQRQLQALLDRQQETSESLAVAAAKDDFSDDDDDDEEEEEGGGGGESGGKGEGGHGYRPAKVAKGVGSILEATTRRCTEMEDKVDDLEAEIRDLRQALDEQPSQVDDGSGEDGAGVGTSARARADKLRITSLEQKSKEEASKVRKLEQEVAKLEKAAAHATATSAKASESKTRKEVEQAEGRSKQLGVELEAAIKGWESSKNDLEQLRNERDKLLQQVSSMDGMGAEIHVLRARAEDATRLESELEQASADTRHLKGLLESEQALRKKYWNTMEDMKGKIRVFARCRPFAQYEINQDCKRAVRIMDESTVEVDGQHGAKKFVFDSVFHENNNQVDVFEDTKNLVQSAIDGYNVCVFAYGQTGSGKTWTMTGGKGDERGLIPRVIEEIFGIVDKAKDSLEAKVSAYFVELYLDNLRDLLWAGDHSKGAPPRLEIHMDPNKMVVIKNVVTKEARDAGELMHLFNAGNQQRKVGGTKMNAGSSRSHSVFSILVEVFNRASKKTTTGKISLVDLAGSERADKTGATADRLKEAQSINKSLSALGDVISALSTNEKFIPYRNNKLTQVMQDSLGGNAKTLMFVNISPADYNQDETATALSYATRVKLITNTAEKQQDGEEVSRLKETIRRLKAGGHTEDDDLKDDTAHGKEGKAQDE